jgi:predicted ATPase
LHPDRSVLAQLASPSIQAIGIGSDLPELFEMKEFFESFDFHQDWEFGADCPPRDPRPAGQSVALLQEDGFNLAQMLAHFKDNHKPIFERLTEFTKRFYEPVKALEVRVVSSHLQVAIEERDGFTTTAYRLSDGMLRWLAILAVLLNPNPAPITCIEEPELGLHPDLLPTLADLLTEASQRTQLIVTTHSASLLDSFSDSPESVCVCEKFDGATEIQRLDAARLRAWLDKYSLGSLWSSGEIGGNRW